MSEGAPPAWPTEILEIADVLADADGRGLRRALVVSALPLEVQAVRAHLRPLARCVAPEGKSYYCGEFAGRATAKGGADRWLVVVAASGMGTHLALRTCLEALRTFGPFEAHMFVGIAASRKSDLPIGSVVAGRKVYYPYGGKSADHTFAARPDTMLAHTAILEIADGVALNGGWTSRIIPVLGGQAPAADTYPQPYPPSAVIGPIVSVESVSADPESELEALISEHYQDSQALEMEGYGAMMAGDFRKTPTLVVRGISDVRADKIPGLDAIYQPIAAMHAAAFAFELLDDWARAFVRSQPLSQEEPIAAPQENPTPPPSSEAESNRFVLNLQGQIANFTPDQLAKVEETLRKLTGDDKIKIVSSEPGSVRLVLEGAQALSGIDPEVLRQALAEGADADLMGALDETRYREAQALEGDLSRAPQDLLAWPQTLTVDGGEWIDRPELATLVDTVQSQESSSTILLGNPGAGKSALLARFSAGLSEARWPVLTIKADLLDPSVATEADLQIALALPELPGALLLKIAALRPVVLVIDQLDALAKFVDLKTGRLNAVLNLVRRLSGRRNVHIVLSARTFEAEHDLRLRAIEAERLELTLPAWPDVLAILEAHGIKAAGWPDDAQTVMRHPQALATLLKLKDHSGAAPFRTYQAMLDQLWQERILRRADGAALSKLVGDVADAMADQEVLWLAAARFDDRAAELETLRSLGFLTRPTDHATIGFTHQTLFEHALARGFARAPGRLSAFVLERESSLFVRPKLWAALTYLRDVEPEAYRQELQTLWAAPALRKHLKQLLIEFLGLQATPVDHEIQLMALALQTPPNREVAFRAIAGRQVWFERMAAGFIAPAMVEDERFSRLSAEILARAWGFAAETVLRMMQDRWASSAAYDVLVWGVLQDAPAWSGEALQLAIKVVTRTDINAFALDYAVATLGVEQPEAAFALVRARLDLDLEKAITESKRRAALPGAPKELSEAYMAWRVANSPLDPLQDLAASDRSWETLPTLAEAHPFIALDTLWPWFKGLVGALRAAEPEHGGFGYPNPYALDFRFEDEHTMELPEKPVLTSLRVAVEGVAAADPDRFLVWLDENEAENSTPAQRLFAHGLASQPEQFASRALAFLMASPQRLFVGDIGDFSGTTKRLVRLVSPHWTEAEYETFEAYLVSFNPPVPDGREDLATGKGRRTLLRIVRQTRLGFLNQLPPDRLSDGARALIVEEHRVFPKDRLGTTFSGVYGVGSPMSAEAFSRASDDDILNAFRQLPDATNWDNPRGFGFGGNIQLSREFSNFAQDNQDRAMAIIARFEPDFGSRAAGYAIEAMAQDGDPDAIVALFLDLAARGFTSQEFRDAVTRGLVKLVNRQAVIDDRVVGVLEGWLAATPPADPADPGDEGGADATTTTIDSAFSLRSDEPKAKEVGPILWGHGGLNILPSGNYPILDALLRILLPRSEPNRMVSLLSAHLGRRETEEVWRALLRSLIYLRPDDQAAFDSFLRRLFAAYPGLMFAPEASFLFAHLRWTMPDLVRDLIAPWATSDDEGLQQAYGELVTLIALIQPDQAWAVEALAALADDARPSSARLGAAFAVTHLWPEGGGVDWRPKAAALMVKLMEAADDDMWSAMFDLFRLVDDLSPDRDTLVILNGFADHMATAKGYSPTFVVERLASLLPFEAPLVARIAKALVATIGADLGDLRTGSSTLAPEFVDLAITLHRDPVTREDGTDLFETMLELDAYLARQTLDEIDNRFRDLRAPVRPRLKRAARRGPRRAARR
jgi:nucleoside phosphorylase